VGNHYLSLGLSVNLSVQASKLDWPEREPMLHLVADRLRELARFR